MKTGGDNCILTSNVLSFETEELLVGSKVCPGIVIIIEKCFHNLPKPEKQDAEDNNDDDYKNLIWYLRIKKKWKREIWNNFRIDSHK